MCHNLFVLSLSVLAAILPHTAKATDNIASQVVGIETSRLPDLNIPRNYHYTLVVDGCPFVVGGHTDGFRPTATAEYFRDGQWHLQNTVYSHDYGMVLQLSEGGLLVAGGFKDDLGIGQLHSVEKYSQGTFDGFGCLDTKRAMANGAEIDSGRVVISGNWYDNDNIELFDGKNGFSFVKEVAQQRSRPFIFRISADDVFIFSTSTTKLNEKNDTVIVDRLHGSPFVPPLFRQWKPLLMELPFFPGHSFIGDETAGYYAYLFPVADSTGQTAIAMLRGETFSLLPTDVPVPMKDSSWRERVDTATSGWRGDIEWFTPVIADRKRHRAYMAGQCKGIGDMPELLYVLVIDYGSVPETGNLEDTPSAARLTLCYVALPPDAGKSIPVITPTGDLLLAGGTRGSNFSSYSAAFVLHVGVGKDIQADAASHHYGWWLLLLALVLLAILFIVGHASKRDGIVPVVGHASKRDGNVPVVGHASKRDSKRDDTEANESGDEQLMQKICQIMEQQQLFLDSRLKISDIAEMLNSNRTYVSNCINNSRGCSFTQFVNGYRVDYAKQLLQQNPDTKLSEVWTSSGFSTESSFFRAFKSHCGMTPNEWKENFGSGHGIDLQ